MAGTDATVAFEDVGHSESAYEMLKDFLIGEVGDKCSQPVESKACAAKPVGACCSKPSSAWYNSVHFFILIRFFHVFSNWSIFAGVAIFGAAVAYKLLSRS